MSTTTSMLYAGRLTRMAIIENGVWLQGNEDLLQDAWMSLATAPPTPWAARTGTPSHSRSQTPVRPVPQSPMTTSRQMEFTRELSDFNRRAHNATHMLNEMG